MAYRKNSSDPKDSERDIDDVWQHDLFEENERMIEADQQFRKRENLAPATINISNLHYNVSKLDLFDLFSEFGKLQDVCIDLDHSGRSLGTAKIRFERKVDAIEAIIQYNGRELDAKPLKIELGWDRYPQKPVGNFVTPNARKSE